MARWGLAVVLLCALLAGCGGGGPTLPAEEVVITFACLDHERDEFDPLVQDFQAANPGVRVQIVSASEAAGMQSEGNTVTSSGNEVHNLAAAADTFAWYATLQSDDYAALLDLETFVQDPAFPGDDFYPGLLDRLKWQGRLHGLPARMLPFLVFYDRAVFDAAGVAYPRAGWTWDDLVAAAGQLTTREGGEVKRYGFVDGSPRQTLLALAQQQGVALWDDKADPPRPLFDSPAVAGLLQQYLDLALTYEVMPVPEIGSNILTSGLINDGRAAMWTDMAFEREWHAQRIDLGLAPFPEGAAAANPSSLYGFFISAGTAQPAAAWRWLSYLSANYQPSLPDMFPARRSVAERLSWWKGLDEETRAVYDYVLAHPAAESPRDNPLWSAAASVLGDGAGIDESLASAQARAMGVQSATAAGDEPVPVVPVASPQPTPEAGQAVVTFVAAPVADEEVYRALAQEFTAENAGIQVEVVPSIMDPEQLVQTADCFWGTAGLGTWLRDRQHLLSLQPLLDADPSLDLADFYPQLLAAVQQDGELWGLPYEAGALMVWARPDRFAEAGLDLPETGWTIQDMLAAATTLGQTGGETRRGFTTAEGSYGDLLFVLERLGAHLYDDGQDPPRPTFADPSVVTALAEYATTARGGALSLETPPAQRGWPDIWIMGDQPPGVEGGQVAMWVDTLPRQAVAPDLAFDSLVLPLPIGQRASTEFEVHAWFISAHSQAPEACWSWLTFLSGRPELLQYLPARRSLAASDTWQQTAGEAAVPAYLATLEYDQAVILDVNWQIPWQRYAQPWLYGAFQGAVDGQDAGAALAEAQANAEALVACLEAAGSWTDPEQLRACAVQVDPHYPLAP